MKKQISAFDHAQTIIEGVRKGALLNTAADGRVNSMLIGWGTIGIEWNKPVFIAYVRHSRFTHDLLEKNGEFTVSVPTAPLSPEMFRILGSVSGRDMDKLSAAGLTEIPSDCISVPGFEEVPLTLECRVIMKQDQNYDTLEKVSLDRFYAGKNAADVHTMYYGEIVNAYLFEKD